MSGNFTWRGDARVWSTNERVGMRFEREGHDPRRFCTDFRTHRASTFLHRVPLDGKKIKIVFLLVLSTGGSDGTTYSDYSRRRWMNNGFRGWRAVRFDQRGTEDRNETKDTGVHRGSRRIYRAVDGPVRVCSSSSSVSILRWCLFRFEIWNYVYKKIRKTWLVFRSIVALIPKIFRSNTIMEG